MIAMNNHRRMTTDRFYGGVSDRLQNLRAMLEYVREDYPSRDQLNEWVLSNTKAGSREAVNHHLAFLASIDLIQLSDTRCRLAEYGKQWLHEGDSKTLYEALSSGVKGFDTILDSLREGPMTDEDMMDLLVSEFQEAEMTTPGPAIRHREWLQVLGFVERKDGVNSLTDQGLEFVKSRREGESPEPISMRTPPANVSVGDQLSKEEIEEAFNTGFGYQISGINPRRDDNDRRYVLVFATEDGPYDDSVTQGQFEYIGEGLQGDQSETSPGNSTLIDAIGSDIPIHFFYQDSGGSRWEYQGRIDVLDYEVEEQDGREVLVFRMRHREGRTSNPAELSRRVVEQEETRLERALQNDPQLTDDEERYTQTRRRARDSAFSKLVRQAYDKRCAVCGSKRESPEGNPEVEGAHIYPKRKGGSDDVRNGIAVCRLHHWAFDVGWFSLSDEYEILVEEAPERNGYHEFKQLEGERIHLPNEQEANPHPMYLEEHRRLHGFTDD